jgi:WD40 repeat protein
VWIWDARAGRHIQTLPTSNPTAIGGVGWSVRFSPDGRFIVSAHTPDVPTRETVGLMIWPVESSSSEKPVGETARTLKGEYYNLAIAPDSRRLAFVNFYGDPKLYCWDFTTNAEPRVLTSDILRSGQNASFTPDSRQLVFLDRQRNVAIFDVANGSKTRSFPTLEARHTGGWANGPNLLLSPDGTKLAVSSASQRGVDVWESATGRLLYSLPEQAATIQWLDWSQDSGRLAASRSDGAIAIWNLRKVDQVLAKLKLNP